MPLLKRVFIHGSTYAPDMPETLEVISGNLRIEEGIIFDIVRTDTASNCRSVMGRKQYEACKKQFGLRDTIKKSTSRLQKGIGESETILGQAKIKIQLLAL